MSRGYWLVKSEADVYPLDQLEQDGRTPWTGIRNYEARNLMGDRMSDGDLVLYYHSNASPPGIVGLARVRGESYPDPTQFDPQGAYHDPKSSPENPRWWLVDLEFVERFARFLPLSELKEEEELSDMVLLRRSRLSVQPVTPREFEHIRRLGSIPPP